MDPGADQRLDLARDVFGDRHVDRVGASKGLRPVFRLLAMARTRRGMTTIRPGSVRRVAE
jgi:hypothetical protein